MLISTLSLFFSALLIMSGVFVGIRLHITHNQLLKPWFTWLLGFGCVSFGFVSILRVFLRF